MLEATESMDHGMKESLLEIVDHALVPITPTRPISPPDVPHNAGDTW
jgi:hypothetical protein